MKKFNFIFGLIVEYNFLICQIDTKNDVKYLLQTKFISLMTVTVSNDHGDKIPLRFC